MSAVDLFDAWRRKRRTNDVSSPGTVRPAGWTPTGTDDESLAARWWQWVALIPEHRNPVVDTDGRFGAEGQPGDVWFLAGTFGGRAERTVTIPTGVPVFFPLLNKIHRNPADEHSAVRVDAAEAFLNGVPLEPRSVATRTFALTWVAGNPLVSGDEGGSAPARTSGTWCRTEPLSPGLYELFFRGRSGGFEVSVTYHLEVVTSGR